MVGPRVMTDPTSAIRAHYAKLALKRLRALPEGKGAEIRERVGADVLAAVRGRTSAGWLPVAQFVAICEAILEALEESATRGFWTELMRDSYDHGLLKDLATMARHSAGPSEVAQRMLATAPQAWTLSAQGCGTFEVVTGEAGESRLRGVDLIPEILHSRGFACVFYGACKAILELVKCRGEVRVYEHLPAGSERPQMAFEIVFHR